MSTRVRADAQKIEHDNYTTAAAASIATKTPTNRATSILLKNTHASNSASVSFDGGTTFYTLSPGEILTFDVDGQAFLSYKIKDTVDNSHATIQALYAEEA